VKETKQKNRKKLVLDQRRSPRAQQTKKFIPDQRMKVSEEAVAMK